MKCRHCGAELTGKFCAECGARSPISDKETFELVKRTRKLFIEGENTDMVARRCAWDIAQSEVENGKIFEPRSNAPRLSAEYCPEGMDGYIYDRALKIYNAIKDYLRK